MDTIAQATAMPVEAVTEPRRLFPVRELGTVVYEQLGPSKKAEIAVVIPLYNYEKTIGECLESVLAQDLEAVSVVVIDDASTDDGGRLAVELLSRHDQRFAAARVVRHRKNQGLSMARNSGIAWSDEPYLFMLDADNRIRRSCLTKLLEALEVSGAAFAYSQLRMFGEVDGLGLADVWEPSRLRDGNYIDAMALLRREALAAAGGYATLANDHGWEDYDLWCRFAGLGFAGVFVPEVLGEYRVHQASMLRAQTSRYVDTLTAELRVRHPRIFAAGSMVSAEARVEQRAGAAGIEGAKRD